MNAIEVEHLQRIYRAQIGVFNRSIKEVVAVDDISFDVQQGELFGLLGPNGAGKTTIVKMLATLLIPSLGSARVGGFDVVKQANEVRKRIGFIFGGERGLYWRISGEDNLRYFASLYGVDPDVSKKRIPYLLEMVGLKGRGNERVGGYSRGMKQRLHVARTLLHDPDILFLDEPTIGLDPVGAREFRQSAGVDAGHLQHPAAHTWDCCCSSPCRWSKPWRSLAAVVQRNWHRFGLWCAGLFPLRLVRNTGEEKRHAGNRVGCGRDDRAPAIRVIK